MFDSAIIGHRMVLPVAAISWESMALVIWCRPVITSGAYSRPKMAAKNRRYGDVRPEYTIWAMPSPSLQPIGPTIVCEMSTASSSEQNGTTIMLMTSGHILRKRRSRYTSTKPAIMAAMTCP